MEIGNKCKISAQYLQNYASWAKKTQGQWEQTCPHFMQLFLVSVYLFLILCNNLLALNWNPYIVGGDYSPQDRWHWTALITNTTVTEQSYLTPICGATLIQPNYVITSAKCVTETP